MTNEDIQKHVRIIIYIILGALAKQGISVDGSYIELSIAVGGLVANYVYSLWGMRLKSKIAELAKIGQDSASPVKGVILTDTVVGRELAKEVPGPAVVEGTHQATVIAKV